MTVNLLLSVIVGQPPCSGVRQRNFDFLFIVFLFFLFCYIFLFLLSLSLIIHIILFVHTISAFGLHYLHFYFLLVSLNVSPFTTSDAVSYTHLTLPTNREV